MSSNLTGSFPKNLAPFVEFRFLSDEFNLRDRTGLCIFYLSLAVGFPDPVLLGRFAQGVLDASVRDLFPVPDDLFPFVEPRTTYTHLDRHFTRQRVVEYPGRRFELPKDIQDFHLYVLARIRPYVVGLHPWLEHLGVTLAPRPGSARGEPISAAISSAVPGHKLPPCLEALRHSAHLPFNARTLVASVYAPGWPSNAEEVVALFFKPGGSSDKQKEELRRGLKAFHSKNIQAMGCKKVHTMGLCPIDIEDMAKGGGSPASACRKLVGNRVPEPFYSPLGYINGHVANQSNEPEAATTKKVKIALS